MKLRPEQGPWLRDPGLPQPFVLVGGCPPVRIHRKAGAATPSNGGSTTFRIRAAAFTINCCVQTQNRPYATPNDLDANGNVAC